jgi:hypothetical protein
MTVQQKRVWDSWFQRQREQGVSLVIVGAHSPFEGTGSICGQAAWDGVIEEEAATIVSPFSLSL